LGGADDVFAGQNDWNSPFLNSGGGGITHFTYTGENCRGEAQDFEGFWEGALGHGRGWRWGFRCEILRTRFGLASFATGAAFASATAIRGRAALTAFATALRALTAFAAGAFRTIRAGLAWAFALTPWFGSLFVMRRPWMGMNLGRMMRVLRGSGRLLVLFLFFFRLLFSQARHFFEACLQVAHQGSLLLRFRVSRLGHRRIYRLGVRSVIGYISADIANHARGSFAACL
jgi:hypothetical protein